MTGVISVRLPTFYFLFIMVSVSLLFSLLVQAAAAGLLNPTRTPSFSDQKKMKLLVTDDARIVTESLTGYPLWPNNSSIQVSIVRIGPPCHTNAIQNNSSKPKYSVG